MTVSRRGATSPAAGPAEPRDFADKRRAPAGGAVIPTSREYGA